MALQVCHWVETACIPVPSSEFSFTLLSFVFLLSGCEDLTFSPGRCLFFFLVVVGGVVVLGWLNMCLSEEKVRQSLLLVVRAPTHTHVQTFFGGGGACACAWQHTSERTAVLARLADVPGASSNFVKSSRQEPRRRITGKGDVLVPSLVVCLFVVVFLLAAGPVAIPPRRPRLPPLPHGWPSIGLWRSAQAERLRAACGLGRRDEPPRPRLRSAWTTWHGENKRKKQGGGEKSGASKPPLWGACTFSCAFHSVNFCWSFLLLQGNLVSGFSFHANRRCSECFGRCVQCVATLCTSGLGSGLLVCRSCVNKYMREKRRYKISVESNVGEGSLRFSHHGRRWM